MPFRCNPFLGRKLRPVDHLSPPESATQHPSYVSYVLYVVLYMYSREPRDGFPIHRRLQRLESSIGKTAIQNIQFGSFGYVPDSLTQERVWARNYSRSNVRRT